MQAHKKWKRKESKFSWVFHHCTTSFPVHLGQSCMNEMRRTRLRWSRWACLSCSLESLWGWASGRNGVSNHPERSYAKLDNWLASLSKENFGNLGIFSLTEIHDKGYFVSHYLFSFSIMLIYILFKWNPVPTAQFRLICFCFNWHFILQSTCPYSNVCLLFKFNETEGLYLSSIIFYLFIVHITLFLDDQK